MSSVLLMQAVASGIVTGCVYALVALSLVIIYKSTDVVNFAGGELVMFGAYVGLMCLVYFEFTYSVMFILAIIIVAIVGALFERIVLTTIIGRRYSVYVDLVPLVVATIGLGYLLKGADHEDIQRAVRAAAAGEAIFGAQIATRVLAYFTAQASPAAAPFPQLTDREREVLELVAQGCSNTIIAARLHLSQKTIRNNVSNILAKLQVADRAQAIVRARDAGLGHKPALDRQ